MAQPAALASSVKPRVRVKAPSIRNQMASDPQAPAITPSVRQTGFDAARYGRRTLTVGVR